MSVNLLSFSPCLYTQVFLWMVYVSNLLIRPLIKPIFMLLVLPITKILELNILIRLYDDIILATHCLVYNPCIARTRTTITSMLYIELHTWICLDWILKKRARISTQAIAAEDMILKRFI